MSAADTLDEDPPEAFVQYCPTCGCSFAPSYSRCPNDNDRLIPIHGSDPMLGRVLDSRYRISRPIGKGGMGTVYEGVQLSMERPVAIKVIADELGGEHETGRRFLRESRVLTSLSHPNIVEVFDFGRTDDGTLYLVMELLRGTTLETELARAGHLPPRRAAEIAIQLCEALVAAHAHGTVHRDLKPANVVLVDGLDGLVKVLDFGLAKSFMGDDGSTTGKITQAGMMIGTPLYMAPESINADVIDDRSDLYALGCMLYEMLAGDPPFVSAAVHIILARQVHEPAPALPEDVPVALRELVARLLAKRPEDRPQSAAEVSDRLAAFLAGDPEDEELPTLIHAPRVSRPSRPSRPSDPSVQPERATIRSLPPPPVMPARSQMMPAAPSSALRVILILLVIAITVFCVVAFLVP